MDLDVTDDLVHGNQEETFFNPYYRGYCYAPLYIFCGKHLLAAKLRSSNLDPAEGVAYILMNAMREKCLVNTEFKNATIGTIRTKLLKLGAVITLSKRRVLITISSACPYKEIFARIYERLSRLPCPG